MSAEIMPGYKQTELGIVPEDWQIQSLPEALQFISGKAHEQFINEAGPYVVVNSKFISTEGSVRKYSSENLCPAKRGDVLMVMSDLPNGRALAKCYLVREDKKYAVNQRVCIFRPTKGSSEYFYYFLNRNKYFMQFDDGVQQTHLLNPIILNCKLKVPPEPEQSRIGQALADIDSLISFLDQLIAKKRDIQQAAMQQLLTGQRRLPGFSGEWEVKRLGEVGAFLKGSGVTRDQSGSGGLPCVRYGEIYTSHHNIVRAFQSFISKEVANNATLLKMGDILFAVSGETKAEIGKCVAFVDNFEAYAGGDIVILRPINSDSTYLGYALNTQEICRQKASRGQGDAVVHISANALSTVEIKLPPKGEQTAIANILFDMDNELATLENRRAKACHMKQGMMQELLTGRARLSYGN